MDNLYDVIIIGGGPSGLTSGIYTSRARLKSLLIESLEIPGQAVIADNIENYPGFPEGINGFDLVEKFKKQAKTFGLDFATGTVEKINTVKQNDISFWQIKTEDKTFNSLSIIVATGASHTKLNVPGEEKFTGKGVSYCATCDGALFRDKDIVLVGGGDAAVEEALFLTKFCRKITLIHRRDSLRATKILQERILSNKKMEFIWDSRVIEIMGEQKVKSVKVKNIKTNEEKMVTCEGVFIFIGQSPNTGFLKGIVELDETGYIVADENMKSSREGIFACGDCRRKLLPQIVTACGDGATAAVSARKCIEKLKGTEYK